MRRREAAAFLSLRYSFQILVLATAPTEQRLNRAISRIVLPKSSLSSNLETIVHTRPTDVSLFNCSLGRPRFATVAAPPLRPHHHVPPHPGRPHHDVDHRPSRQMRVTASEWTWIFRTFSAVRNALLDTCAAPPLRTFRGNCSCPVTAAKRLVKRRAWDQTLWRFACTSRL